jgi:hypothetical protein
MGSQLATGWDFMINGTIRVDLPQSTPTQSGRPIARVRSPHAGGQPWAATMADTRAAPVLLPLVRVPAGTPSAVPGTDTYTRAGDHGDGCSWR